MLDQIEVVIDRQTGHHLNAMMCWLIHPKNKQSKLLTQQDRNAIEEYIRAYADAIQR